MNPELSSKFLIFSEHNQDCVAHARNKAFILLAPTNFTQYSSIKCAKTIPTTPFTFSPPIARSQRNQSNFRLIFVCGSWLFFNPFPGKRSPRIWKIRPNTSQKNRSDGPTDISKELMDHAQSSPLIRNFDYGLLIEGSWLGQFKKYSFFRCMFGILVPV